MLWRLVIAIPGVDVNPDKIRLSGPESGYEPDYQHRRYGAGCHGRIRDADGDGRYPKISAEGVEIFDDNYEVTFTLKIEPLRQRTFTLETNTLIINDIPEQLTYSIQESSVSLTISGLEEDLDQLEANGLKASISLRGLAAGEHKVLVTPILTGGGYGRWEPAR